jgi:hypothetical protein
MTRKWSTEEPEAILDYLHGDVPRDEAKPCCYYEYARTSQVFQSARQEYEAADAGDPIHRVIERFLLFFNDWQRLEVLICPSFPELPWGRLSKERREDIQYQFTGPRATPLITDSFILNSLGIFDRFKEQAQLAARELRHRRWRRREQGVGHDPAVVGAAIKHIVVTLDYRAGPGPLKKQIRDWLASEENLRLLDKHHKISIDKRNQDSPDRYKEHLKYLAAWRLYDDLGIEGAMEWTQKHRRQDERPNAKRIKLKAFFREKPEKTTEADKQRFGKQFFGPLYSDPRDWEKAIAKAKDFLAREIELSQSADVG